MEIEKGNFGSYLKQQRLQKGYTIPDVESEIKIRGLYIEAIENENFAQLPPRVYTVGFVRRYCSFLQVEEMENIVQYYKETISRQEEESQPVPAMQGIETSSRGGTPLEGKRFVKVRYDRVLLTVLLILGVAWAGIFAFSFISEKWEGYQQRQAEKEIPSQEETLPPENVTPEIPPVEEEPPVEENIPWEQLQVRLTIKEGSQCWLSATADGNQVFSGMKNSGETLEFEANNQFSLQLGNAGAVQLWVNETDVTGAQWSNGEVLRVEYTLEEWNQRQLNEANT